MGAFARAGIGPTAVSPQINKDSVNGMTGAEGGDEEEIEYEESYLMEAWEHGEKAPVTPRLNSEEGKDSTASSSWEPMRGTNSEDKNAETKAKKKSDEERQEEEDKVVESKKVKIKRAPRVPSAAEVEAHMASGHVNYRDWCKHCVHGQAVSDRHSQSKEEGEFATISIDYTFFGESSKERKERKEKKGRVTRWRIKADLS